MKIEYENFRNIEFCLFEEFRDRHELRVVFPLISPVDTDEIIVNGSFHPGDGATGCTTFDRDHRDGYGWIDLKKLSGGGEDGFSGHGRRNLNRKI